LRYSGREGREGFIGGIHIVHEDVIKTLMVFLESLKQ
jgi:hypothetical protein